MRNNKDYADLLEIYADIIRKDDYELSTEQKKMIKNLGESICERIVEKSRNRKHMEADSKKILENSSFELIRKSREEEKKQALEKSNIKLVRSIGKAPGE